MSSFDTSRLNPALASVFESVQRRDPAQAEFHQAVYEVLLTIAPLAERHPEYADLAIIDRIVEPERQIQFRVPWADDKGNIHVNRGFRVQFNSALGPYKGGLRFHPSVNLSIIKFLGFEQIFKNALTGLPMGGGKGGADFDPKGKSDAEVMRFCQSFMTELSRHIGPDTDVPAGDIGVGGREIGYMYGMYKKLAREHSTGALTGKAYGWGGSLIRPEATGFGAMYYVDRMVRQKGETMNGKTIALSGFGNVAWGAATKATELGAKVVALSGPDGVCELPNGIDQEMIDYMLVMRDSRRNKVQDMADKFPGKAVFTPGKKAWSVKCDIACPSAFQNEMNEEDAKMLIANKVQYVAEISNMGCQPAAIAAIQNAGIPFAPGKAVNAGGVSTSGLEISQNASHINWTAAEVDQKLHKIMNDIYDMCVEYGKQADGTINYVKGANIAGFMKVAHAMMAQGIA